MTSRREGIFRSPDGGTSTVAKLYQHQTDETYYTRINIGGIVTRQIHPDGVAYLKHCGVRVGKEIPSYCMSRLRDYGWLFTKDKAHLWGEVDWAPRWATIRARPLDDLRPFRQVPSVAEWIYSGSPSGSSAADDLLAEIQAIRENAARERDAKWQRLIADIEAKRRATREAQERAKPNAKTTQSAPSPARLASASRDTGRQSMSVQSTPTGARAVRKAESPGKVAKPSSETTRKAPVPHEQSRSPTAIPADPPRPSAIAISLAARPTEPSPERWPTIDPIPLSRDLVQAGPDPAVAIPLTGHHAGMSLTAAPVAATALPEASSRLAWTPTVKPDAPQSTPQTSGRDTFASAAGLALPMALGIFVVVGAVGTFAQWIAASFIGFMFLRSLFALALHMIGAALDDWKRNMSFSEWRTKLGRHPGFRKERKMFAHLLLLLSAFGVSIARDTNDISLLRFILVVTAVWAMLETWKLRGIGAP
jgi:hypothetical protein